MHGAFAGRLRGDKRAWHAYKVALGADTRIGAAPEHDYVITAER